MICLTRVACKFMPPKLGMEYVKNGDGRKRVKELDLLPFIMESPEVAMDTIDRLYPWIFEKTNAKRETFLRLFTKAQEGYLKKMEEMSMTDDSSAGSVGSVGSAGVAVTDDSSAGSAGVAVTDACSDRYQQEFVEKEKMCVLLRSSVESKKSHGSFGSRDRYGEYGKRHPMHDLSISTTFEHGLLSELALELDDDIDDLC